MGDTFTFASISSISFSNKDSLVLVFFFLFFAEYDNTVLLTSIKRTSRKSWSDIVSCTSFFSMLSKFSKLYTGRAYCFNIVFIVSLISFVHLSSFKSDELNFQYVLFLVSLVNIS